MTRPARILSHRLLGVAGWLKLAPPDALVAGAKINLFTPMQLYVARKPEYTDHTISLISLYLFILPSEERSQSHNCRDNPSNN